MDALEAFNRELEKKNLLGFWTAGLRSEIYEAQASYQPLRRASRQFSSR
jgi:hypothetical protein